MVPAAVRLSRSRVPIVAAAVLAVVLTAGGCAGEAATETTLGSAVGSAVSPATAGTTPGSVVATVPPAAAAATAAPTTIAGATTTVIAKGAAPTSAPSTPTTAASGGGVRGLAVTTSTVTYVDRSRPTVSHGRTVAATRTLTTTIVRPTGASPYPLVVFAHGYQLGPASYQHLLGVIASAGYVVAAPSFPLADANVAGGNLDRGDIPNQSGDLSFVIDQILAGPLAGSVDRSRIGAVGHSDGADTVLDLGYHPQRLDTRVRAVAALSPDAMTSAAVGGAPLLIVHGDRDTIVPYSNATAVFGQVPAHRFLVTLVGADHLPPVQGAAPWASVVEDVVLDLLDQRVAGRTGSDDALVHDASVAGVATVRGAG